MAKMQDVRKTIEGSLGNLTPTRAQEIAKGMLDRDVAKEQVAKTAADLMDWSQRNKNRLTMMIRSEVRSQLKQAGVATEEELNVLRKRVRELERAAKRPGARSTAAKKKTAAKKTTAKRTGAGGAGPAGGWTPSSCDGGSRRVGRRLRRRWKRARCGSRAPSPHVRRRWWAPTWRSIWSGPTCAPSSHARAAS